MLTFDEDKTEISKSSTYFKEVKDLQILQSGKIKFKG